MTVSRNRKGELDYLDSTPRLDAKSGVIHTIRAVIDSIILNF